MSKTIIEHFDFGKSSGVSLSQREKESSLPPDNLILVDAFWIKDGMIIRFIPHQMGSLALKDNISITLIVVFVFEHNNAAYDKDKAEFELTFESSDDTIYSKQEPKKIKISGATVKNNKFDNGQIGTTDFRDCYYYEIKNFSSDLSEINQ